MPVSAITCIYQDKEGYMWYGTVDGLCRDDGYNVHVFRSDFHTPGLMQINSVLAICEDNNQRIWYGTAKGVYVLDKKNYSIKPINIRELQSIWVGNVNSTSDGSIWISAQRMLYHIAPNGRLVGRIRLSGKVSCFYEDSHHNVFCSTEGNYLYIKKAGSNVFHRTTEPFFISSIIEINGHSGLYYVGTSDGKIESFMPFAKRGSERYHTMASLIDSYGNSDNSAIDIIEDNNNHYLWVKSIFDLYVFKRESNNTLRQLSTTDFLPYGKKLLSEIYKSHDGSLWVAGFDCYSFTINFRKDAISIFPYASMQQRTRFQPAIVTLCRDKGGCLWYYQENGGLFLYDINSDRPVSFRDCPQTAKQPLDVVPYLVRSQWNNSIWVMTIGSKIFNICRTGLQMNVQKVLDMKTVTRKQGALECIFEDRYGNLWISTMNGVYEYVRKTDRLKIISEYIGDVSDFTQTPEGNVWCAIRNKGICRISQRGEFRIYPYDMDFLTISASSNGTIWAGTGEGRVLAFNSSTAYRYKDYSQIIGLNGDMVDHIKVDHYNNIWIVTNQRIREFNPANGAYRIFTTMDAGIPLRRFLPRAVYVDPLDNRIYIGGIPGLLAITPKRLIDVAYQNPKVVISDVKVMERSIWFGTSANKKENSIEILPDEQYVRIEFSSLDYSNCDKIRYAYKLKGVDNDWIYLPVGKNFAVYNQLPKGDYVFQVKATDENGLWSKNITEFTIHRLPAWYETWLAYTLYTLLLIFVCGYIIFLYHQRLNERNDKKVVENLAQAKLRYFTNISHELLTPLTIIKCIIGNMANTDSNVSGRIEQIRINIERLQRLLKQILDFRKIEANKMRLYVSYGDIVEFTSNICKISFEPLATNKNVRFSVVNNVPVINGYFDHDKLDKIIFNLLSNAFKYTKGGKSITVTTGLNSDDRRMAYISVADEGVGIAHKEINKIFTRFYSANSNTASESNGIGLSLTKELVELHHGSINVRSQLGEGSVFTVEIPVDKDSYSSEEMKEEIQERQKELLSMTAISGENKEDKKERTILVVEDNDELLSLMNEILSSEYNVLTARNGVEALEKIEKDGDIEFVVSDIRMPVMDGIELCSKLKNDIHTSHLIVVLLTAMISTETQVATYNAGADAYLPKPFETKVLLGLLDNLWSQKEKRRQTFKHDTKVKDASALGIATIDEKFVNKAIKVVEDNISNADFDVVALASELGMSRSTFARKIKAVLDQTPLDFIRSIKLKHAYMLLQNKTATIQGVMEAIGYSDHKTFTTSFKDTFGINPSELLKQNK
jgi:signal transduction histidine kinase/CheY-like chemotaxis protein/AraC-like DNA-binding protein/ligand-binding sensor domain-containing protein